MKPPIQQMLAAGLLFVFTSCEYSGNHVDTTALHRMLVLAASCDPDNTTSISRMFGLYSHMMYLGDRVQSTEYKKLSLRLDCMLQAQDCESYLACKVATLDMRQACGQTPGYWACSQDVLVSCDITGVRLPIYYDCAAAGLTCGQGDMGADCGLGACDQQLYEPACDGSLLLECEPGANVTIARDCWYETLGGVCNDDSGIPRCRGTGPECNDVDFENHCEGEEFVSCLYGRENRIDCREWNPSMTCRYAYPFLRDGYACAYEHEECYPDSGDSCLDEAIVFCADGRYRHLDCREYGFSTCATAQPFPRETIAFCLP